MKRPNTLIENLKYTDHRCDLLTDNLEKQDSFRHIFQSSAVTYESSSPQIFSTYTGIQSGEKATVELIP